MLINKYPIPYSSSDCQIIADRLKTADLVAIDIETSGFEPDDALDPWRGFLCGIGIAWWSKKEPDTYSAAYFPFYTNDTENIGLQFDPKKTINNIYRHVPEHAYWLMHNAKFDLKWMERASDVRWEPGQLRDTMIEAWMYRTDEPKGLKDLIVKFYPERDNPVQFSELLGRGKNKKKLEDVPILAVADYCMDDCINTLLIGEKLHELIHLESPKLWDIYRAQEIPILRILTDMELHGVKIDKDRLEELSVKLYAKQQRLQAELDAFATINWNSTQQVVQFLKQEKVQLPPRYTATGQQQLTRDILLQIEDDHPAISALLDLREVGKLLKTYAVGFSRKMDSDGRLHGSFNQAQTRTGRLSATEPNLQNIPTDGFKKKDSRLREEYKTLRELFIHEYNTPLIHCDLSQIEMRFAAHFSGDPALLHIYENNLDIHENTAREVTNGDRTLAKNCNFGALYGQEAKGLSNLTGMPIEEARVYVARFKKTYAGMFTWVNIVKAHARRNKYVETILGRRRYFPDITSSNWKLKGDAERATVNTVVQGSAADYLKQAMINMVDQGLASLGYQMVLQVHDELVFAPIRELADEEIEKALEFIQYHMENAIELRVPIIAQPKTVWTWGEAK